MSGSDAILATIALSVRGSRHAGPGPVLRALRDRDHPPLDLDLAAASAVQRLVGPPAMSGFSSVAPVSVWLPDRMLSVAPADFLAAVPDAWRTQPPTLVIDLDGMPETRFADLGAIYRLATASRRQATGSAVLLGLRARHIAGGRRHLASLTLLRRSLEEWDLGIALDLSGPFDPQWEAEAAIVRLGGRLRLLRIGSDVMEPQAIDRSRVARRAMRAALEHQPLLNVAVTPRTPWWRRFTGDERESWDLTVLRLRQMMGDARDRAAAREHADNPTQRPHKPSGSI